MFSKYFTTFLYRTQVIKTTSFRMHHVIMNDMNEIIAEAQDIIVLYDFEKHTKRIIPDDIKNRIINPGNIK